MAVLKWSAAAAVIILVGAGIYFFSNTNKTDKNNNLAKTNGAQQVTPAATDTPLLAKEDPSQQSVEPQQKEEPAVATSDYDQEMYHYAKLVEIKQNQIKQIKKEEPLLYQKFAGDINKLDSAFHTLKKQLPVNPNREQLLEAMIDNLKMQEAVLNQQLNIIKQINQVKKSEYEKAYKSI
jgi:predicted methyltransferase